MHRLALLLLFAALTPAAYAQYQIGLIPRVSPDKAIQQTIGYTDVHITYGSPAVKGRSVWGGLVPYDAVWRAGANDATTVTFSSAVVLQGDTLAAGTYGLFVIPRQHDAWTVAFNQVSNQWGAFNYDEREDALRVEVIPRQTRYHTEDLTYAITQFGFQHGRIVLRWDYLAMEIPFTTPYISAFRQAVERRASDQPEHVRWVVYLQGADHLEATGLDHELALRWADQAEVLMNATSAWNNQFYPRAYVAGHLYWTKAKLLAAAAHREEAVAYVERLKALDDTSFYARHAEVIDRTYAIWTEQ